MSYQWNSGRLIAVKFQCEDRLYWVRGDYVPGQKNDTPLGWREEDSEVREGLEGRKPPVRGRKFEVVTQIADVTFTEEKVAKKVALELLMDLKSYGWDYDWIKVVDLTNCPPSYREHQVLEFHKGDK